MMGDLLQKDGVEKWSHLTDLPRRYKGNERERDFFLTCRWASFCGNLSSSLPVPMPEVKLGLDRLTLSPTKLFTNFGKNLYWTKICIVC